MLEVFILELFLSFLTVHEIANQMEFKKLCEEKLIESQKILTLQLENEKNLTTLLMEVKTLASDLELVGSIFFLCFFYYV